MGLINALLPYEHAHHSDEVIRSFVVDALDAEITPCIVTNGVVSRPIKFPDVVLDRLRSVGQAQFPPMSPSKVVGCMLRGRFPLDEPPIIGELPRNGLRDEQHVWLCEILRYLIRGCVVIAEAGTGFGKAVGIVHAAAAALAACRRGEFVVRDSLAPEERALDRQNKSGAKDPPERTYAPRAVVIAAPTIANVVQLVREWGFHSQYFDAAGDYKHVVLLGRSQYASASAVRAQLEQQAVDGCVDAGVKAWADADFPAGQTAETRLLASDKAFQRLLIADLRAVATDFDCDDCVLTDRHPEADQQPYLMRRAAALEADIVFCTHSMLAHDNMAPIRKHDRLLPPARLLIVDEAHLYERAQAQALTHQVSLMSISRWDKRSDHGHGYKTAMQAVIGCNARLMSALCTHVPGGVFLPAAERHNDDETAIKWQSHVSSVLGETVATLKDLLQRVSRVSSAAPPQFILRVKTAYDALSAALVGEQFGEVSFSRAFKFPSFIVGPRSVAPSLGRLWAHADSVLLTSATMLTVDADQLSPRDFGYLNALPMDRTVMIKPIAPSWLYTTTKLYWPKASGHKSLCPPSANDPGDFAEALVGWGERIAVEVYRIASTAVGGTLVLCTGFDRAALIAAGLKTILDRVILQSPTLSVGAAEKTFREMHAAGQRPIWLSTGGAWTGLNLTLAGCAPSDDFLLTDLVIPALPFGTNLTTSHAFRSARKGGFLNELAHAELMFRQGIGRLVRREGLRNRCIHILDGRLHSKLRMMQGFRQIIGTYPHQKQY